MLRKLSAAFLGIGLAVLPPVTVYGALGDSSALGTETPEVDFSELEDELRELMGDELYSQMEAYSGMPPEEIRNGGEVVICPKKDMSYNQSTHMMDYHVMDGGQFSSSVPDGMITTEPVTFRAMENAYVTVTRNGTRVENAEDGYYSQEGRYHIRMLGFSGNDGSIDGNIYQIDFYFQIIPEVVSRLNLLHAPEGFAIERLELDGIPSEAEFQDGEFLHQDGHYRVWFADQATGNIRHQISFTRDTIAPLMAFTPEVNQSVMKGPVQIELLDMESGLRVYYDGSPVTLSSPLLQAGGQYLFHVRDRAGNERFYTLNIEKPTDLPDNRLIIIIIIGIAGLLGWMFWQRSHMRFL